MADLGIRKDLVFKNDPSTMGLAMGTNGFRRGSGVIYTSERLYDEYQDGMSFMLKHEITHIKHADPFCISLSQAITGIALGAFFSLYLSFLPAFALTYLLSTISGYAYTYIREKRADATAIKHATIEELHGARLLFSALAQMHKNLYSLYPSYSITPDGEARFDFAHPSLKSRIKLIEDTIVQKSGHLEPIDSYQLSRATGDLLNQMASVSTRAYVFQNSIIGIMTGGAKNNIKISLRENQRRLDRANQAILMYQDRMQQEASEDWQEYYKKQITFETELEDIIKEEIKETLETEAHPFYFLNPRTDRSKYFLTNGSYNWPGFFKLKLA